MGGSISSSSTSSPDTNPSAPTDTDTSPSSVAAAATAMSSQPDPKSPESETPKLPEPSIEEKPTENVADADRGGAEEEEEEEGECGFCLFMKGGGCKDAFIAWENCVEEGEKNKEDIVEKCYEVTAALKKCMEAHADYYEPILRAEKAAEEELKKEVEDQKEAEARDEEQSVTIEVPKDDVEKKAASGNS